MPNLHIDEKGQFKTYLFNYDPLDFINKEQEENAMGKTITILETEYNLMKRKIREFEDQLQNEENPMPEEIVAYEYLVDTGIKRDWKHGDEGYGRNSPKWWRELPQGHNLKMVRQAKYKKVK